MNVLPYGFLTIFSILSINVKILNKTMAIIVYV